MIYTFGDGYAAGHIWPEWPQMLELLYPDIGVYNFGHIGAGNEFIFNCAVKAALTASSTDLFVIQWALPTRFDKMIEDDSWIDINTSDTVYKGIYATQFGQHWWTTSASVLPIVTTYHSVYIQREQAMNTSILYMISLSKMLHSLNI